MLNPRVIELTNKLYNGEIDVKQFSKSLKKNGYNVNYGTGLCMESFDTERGNINRNNGLIWRLIGLFR